MQPPRNSSMFLVENLEDLDTRVRRKTKNLSLSLYDQPLLGDHTSGEALAPAYQDHQGFGFQPGQQKGAPRHAHE